MDQLRTRVGSTFGVEELGGQGIDDPGVAQPSIEGIGNPEAGSADGSLDKRDEVPAEGPGVTGGDIPEPGPPGTDIPTGTSPA